MWPFSKKRAVVEVEMQHPNGAMEKRVVDKAQFYTFLDQAVSQGSVEVIDGVTVHILDGLRGYQKERWFIGEGLGLTRVQYDKFQSDGQIYVTRHYEGGHPITQLVHKSFWDITKEAFE